MNTNWKGEETVRGGVVLIVKHTHVESVKEMRRVCPRIISMDVEVNEKVITAISVYVPQSGRSRQTLDYSDSYYSSCLSVNLA